MNTILHGNTLPVSELILMICRGTADDRAVTQLANLCIDMATGYLKYLESTGRRIRETDDKGEYYRIAADGIAELFTRDAKGQYLIWRRVFAGLVVHQALEHEWQSLLRRLVTRRIQQRLLLLYQERDPESARLLRNIRLSAKRLTNVRLVRDMLGLTLEYYPSSLPVGYHFVRPPLPLLQAILIQVFRPSLTVDQIVARLLERLSSLVDAPVLMAVEDLAALMSECRRNVQMIEEQESLQIEDDDALRFCLQAAKRSLAVLEKKLHQQYVNHGKLTLSEAAALMDVLSRTLYSRLQGEDVQAASLSAALAARPEFSDHQRRTTVRPLVDYLLKLYRREMNERVGEILS